METVHPLDRPRPKGRQWGRELRGGKRGIQGCPAGGYGAEGAGVGLSRHWASLVFGSLRLALSWNREQKWASTECWHIHLVDCAGVLCGFPGHH